MAGRQLILASGFSVSGAAWVLGWRPGAAGQAGVTWLRLTTVEGRTHTIDDAHPPHSTVNPKSAESVESVTIHASGSLHGPNGAILHVPGPAIKLGVVTADGITYTVQLVPHPAGTDRLVGALVYPADTTITMVRLIDQKSTIEVPVTRQPT